MADWQATFGTAHPVALITGSAAPRIGRCTAEQLAERGFRLAIHANRSQSAGAALVAEFAQQGVEAIAVGGDLTDEQAARQIVHQVCEHFGRIDVLVNSAAIWEAKPLEQVTAEDLRRHLEVNVVGSFLCAQEAGLRMVAQPTGGVIVNLGDWAIARPYLNYAAYFPSKGSIPAMTRSLAVELASRNSKIRVNAVAPGPVTLPPEMPPHERQAAVDGTLLKREGSPEHVAHAILFLIENEYVTGVCLPVDGGRTVCTTDGSVNPDEM